MPTISPSYTFLFYCIHNTNCSHHTQALPLRSVLYANFMSKLKLSSKDSSNTSRDPSRSRPPLTWSSRRNFRVYSHVSQITCIVDFRSHLNACKCLLCSLCRTPSANPPPLYSARKPTRSQSLVFNLEFRACPTIPFVQSIKNLLKRKDHV